MLKHALAGLAAATAVTVPAFAGDTYVSVSGAAVFLRDSFNEGRFTAPFTTGTGTTIPLGTVIPAGTTVDWTTEFRTGWAVNGAIGRRYGAIRGELEVAYQDNNINTHRDVRVGGAPIGTENAAVLVTGSPPLGANVATLVNSGIGSVDTLFLMANGYWDVDLGSWVKPYIGGGVGVGFADVNYSPSNVVIINDRDTVFAWQVGAGLNIPISGTTELFAGYRYRNAGNVEVTASLFPAAFEIDNRAHLFEGGLRFSF